MCGKKLRDFVCWSIQLTKYFNHCFVGNTLRGNLQNGRKSSLMSSLLER